MPTMALSRETPFKSIPYSPMSRIYKMLDVGAKYKDLAAALRKRNGDAMFNCDDISILDLELMKSKSPSKAVFQRWSYEFPSIGMVLDQLYAIGLNRAADFIREDTLKETPAIRADHQRQDDVVNGGRQNIPVIHTEPDIKLELKTGECQSFEFKDLHICTQCFSQNNKIGSGGSCNVFKGQSQKSIFAVKIFKDVKADTVSSYKKQFENEIKALSNLKHEHILTLFGYSIDGPNPCLVYEFMPGGSLEDRLSSQAKIPSLTIAQRLFILRGSAEGVEYIHSQNKIHRDIKSANILLTQDLVPKIGDFGTLREGPSKPENTCTHTAVVTGTHGYMAPEYYESVVSPGLDNYAFGVILMECLTGLPCFDPKREDKYLITHIKETCDTHEDILDEVDKRAGSWSNELAFAMYKTSVKLWATRKQRWSMTQALAEMRKWTV